MGHYAAEMQCDKCRSFNCTCPLPPDKTANHWVVAEDYQVMRAGDYADSKGGNLTYLARTMRKHHPKRKDAEEEARLLCEAAVEAARAQLTRLKKVLKVDRPWEKKRSI